MRMETYLFLELGGRAAAGLRMEKNFTHTQQRQAFGQSQKLRFPIRLTYTIANVRSNEVWSLQGLPSVAAS